MGDDVRLRDVEKDDLEVFYEAEHNPEAVRRSHFTPRDHDAFMTHWETRVLGDPTVFIQAVVVDDAVAGSVVAWWEGDRRFIGYWLGQAFWGRGIGRAMLAAFLAREQVRPLYADPFSGNTASVRLLERCGFAREGTIRHGDDEHVMLVLRDPTTG
jgi:RimJ/RimL family protein N-acetyltransferase